jgi:hypothetical protein
MKERKKSLTRGHVTDIGSTVGIKSYEGEVCEGVTSGKCVSTSLHPHLCLMAVLSGARIVHVLWVCVAAPF